MDFHVWPWFERFPAIKMITGYDVIPVDRYPKLIAWVDRMMRLEAVKQTFEPPELHMQFLMGLMQGEPQYDIEQAAQL